MKRLLRSCVVTTIVAAFQVFPAAAVAASEDVPVPGGIAAIAKSLGVDPPPDRARFMSELTRVAHAVIDGRSPFDGGVSQGAGRRGAPPAQSGTTNGSAPAADLVPVPLTPAIWSDAVFHRRVAPADLVLAILNDREASLLCHGLAGLDDETLQFLAEHPAIVTHLYERDAATFAAFAGSLHVHDGRVVTPGGEAAAPLWEAALGEKVTKPERFVRQLFSRSDGRVAYLYDGIGQLDAPHEAFAFGLWIKSAPVRAERFKALTELTRSAYHEWQLKTVPFARPVYDIVSLLMRVQVAPDGTPMAPASRAIWSRAFESAGLPAVGAKLPKDDNEEPVDAAWLAQTIASGDVHQRGDRLDQFSFGQRAFAGVADGDRADMLVALRGFTRYRMLMLTLEQVGITKASVYSAAARHAGRLAAVDRARGFTALAQFQGTLALVARMVLVRTLDVAKAEALITSLSAVPLSEQGYGGNLLEWVGRELRRLTPAADDMESGLIAQLAGVRPARDAVRVTWEGQAYRLDLAAAEERRLHRIRERQNGLSLDVGLDLESVARKLSADSVTMADLTAAIVVLKKAVVTFPVRSKGETDIVPAGVEAPRDPREVLTKVVDELVRVERSRDVKKAARIVEPLTPIAEGVGAEALLSLAYAVSLGDPDGTVLLAANVARRHDFGFTINDVDVRTRTAWTLPKQDVSPGVPWHVNGSALGLDVGLATLALRRVDTGRVNEAPKLTSNERQTFAASVALLNPVTLIDAGRDAIAAAIARGRQRIAALTPQTLDGVLGEIAMDGWRRRAVKWTMANDPASVASLFSLTEALTLGGGQALPGLHAWGMAAVVSTGCLCTRLAAPGGWWNLSGRPQLGLLATAVADLHLQVAVTLHDLGLPAAVARHVLSAAVQDYIDEVKPNDTDDWLSLVRGAQAISRERMEDYVAAITADGPLVPDTTTGAARR